MKKVFSASQPAKLRSEKAKKSDENNLELINRWRGWELKSRLAKWVFCRFLPKMLNKLFCGWVITMIIDYIQASLASLEAGHSDHHLLTATIKSYLRWVEDTAVSSEFKRTWSPGSCLSPWWEGNCTRIGWRQARWYLIYHLKRKNNLPLLNYQILSYPPIIVSLGWDWIIISSTPQEGDDKFDAVWNLLQHEHLPRENYKNIQYLFKVFL